MSVEFTQFHDDHRPLRERSEIGGNALLAFAPETTEPDRPIQQPEPGGRGKPGKRGDPAMRKSGAMNGGWSEDAPSVGGAGA